MFQSRFIPCGGRRKPVSFKDVTLDTNLVTLTKVKKVVRGEVTAKDGEVIEYMGQAPAEINISGTITGQTGNVLSKRSLTWPKFDAPIAIDVVNEHLNQMGVHSIVILTATLPQEPGGLSYQTFDISAIEDIKQNYEYKVYNAKINIKITQLPTKAYPSRSKTVEFDFATHTRENVDQNMTDKGESCPRKLILQGRKRKGRKMFAGDRSNVGGSTRHRFSCAAIKLNSQRATFTMTLAVQKSPTRRR